MTLVGDGVAAGILNGNQLAPGIVNVAADNVSLVVVDADNVALQVAQVVVIGRIVQLEAARAACVIGEAQRVCAVGLLYQRTAHIGVFGCGASGYFFRAQAAFVVLVADIQAVACDAFQLAAFLPGVGIAGIGQRVSAVSVLVVADGIAVVGCQLVLPIVVAVAVIDCRCGRSGRTCGVGVFLLLREVSAAVVGIGAGLVLRLIVLPHQPVQAVVDIGGHIAVLVRDSRNVSVGIIGKAVIRENGADIGTVHLRRLHRSNQTCLLASRAGQVGQIRAHTAVWADRRAHHLRQRRHPAERVIGIAHRSVAHGLELDGGRAVVRIIAVFRIQIQRTIFAQAIALWAVFLVIAIVQACAVADLDCFGISRMESSAVSGG